MKKRLALMLLRARGLTAFDVSLLWDAAMSTLAGAPPVARNDA
jgi:hypothetical protein